MAKKDDAPQKKQSTWSIIKTMYTYTAKVDKPLPWLLALCFIVPIAVFVVLGLVFHWNVVSWVLFMVLAVMLGLLLGTFVLGKRFDRAAYAKMDGTPGAGLQILQGLNKRGYFFFERPIWGDRDMNIISLGTGYQGIYLVGEGNASKITPAMNTIEKEIKRQMQGSAIDFNKIIIGAQNDSKEQIKAARESGRPVHVTLNRLQSLVAPTFKRRNLTKPELEQINGRLRTYVKRKETMNLPKGMDPTRMKINRRAMRGR